MSGYTNVILFTRGTMGDIYPFLHVGRTLKEMGCRITLVSNYRYFEQAENEGFGFVALDDKERLEYLNNIPESQRKLPSLLELYRNLTPISLAKELALLEGLIDEGKTVVLAHSNDYLVPLLAKERNQISLYLCVLAPSFVYSFFFFEGVMKNLSEEVNEVLSKVGMRPILDWSSWAKGFSKAFAFWPDWFEDGQQNDVIKMENVGFPSVESVERRRLQKEVTAFVESESRTVAITHGTSRPFRENYFRLAIEACRSIGCKLIVITPFKEYLPPNVSEYKEVLVVDYCPFHELLPQVDLIIHHGGIGTVRESMACGIPQLIIGKGYDRPHNGKIVKRLKVGDWISPNALSVELLTQTVNSLLNSYDVAKSCMEHKKLLAGHKISDSFYHQIVCG